MWGASGVPRDSAHAAAGIANKYGAAGGGCRGVQGGGGGWVCVMYISDAKKRADAPAHARGSGGRKRRVSMAERRENMRGEGILRRPRAPPHAATTLFRSELLRDLDLDGARSESGTLCQPVTSGSAAWPCPYSDCASTSPE